MSTMTRTDILGLSVAERILLVEDIWDSITELPDEVQLTGKQIEELDRRLEAHHRNPDAGSPWAVVRERIRSRA